MRKTKILLLAGVVLPAFAIAAPSFATPRSMSEGAIVVAQEDGGGREQRRQERQQERSDRQDQRQQDRQERQQTRDDKPSREERQQSREDKPSREDRQQSRDDKPSREDRQQSRDDKPSREERQQTRDDKPSREERQQSRDDKPSREDRQQQREDRKSGANDNNSANPGGNGGRPQRDQTDRQTGSDIKNSDGKNSDGKNNDRSSTPSRGPDGVGARDRDQDRANQKPSNAGSDRSNASDRPNASGNSGDSGGRLQQMREDRDRDRANGRNNDDRPGRDADRQDRRDDRQDRRDDARQDKRDNDKRDDAKRDENRDDRLRDRLKDERRENERLGDKIDKLKDERKETRDGDRIIITEPGGRRIIRDGNRVIINRNENARFVIGVNPRDIREERRGGEIRTVVTRPDGSRVITVTDDNGRLIRRVREYRGQEYVLIDNRPRGGRDGLFINLDIAPPRVSIPRERYIVDADVASEDDIYDAFSAEPVERLDRSYSLDEIRQSAPLRQYVRSVDLDSVTFDTGSWYVRDDQISKLEKVGQAMETAVKKNPRTVFMVEGHTDAVGSDEDNLSLSDRRAEAVAEVLTKYFDIPAENLTTQGYGEQYLKVQTDGPEERNRRVTVRNITRLLTSEK